MMIDPMIKKWAHTLVRYSCKVKRSELVQISGDVAAEPLLKAIYDEVLAVGAHPQLRVSLSGVEEMFLSKATDEQLSFQWPDRMYMARKLDVAIFVSAETNTRALSNIEPKKQGLVSKASHKYRDLLMKRSAEGTFRWCITQFPTEAYAQEAGCSLEEYENFVLRACMLDKKNPLKEWQAVEKRQERIVKWLTGSKRIEVKGPDVELSVDVTKRKWINCCGDCNFPDGEVFTSPIETGVEGTVRFTHPVCAHGRKIDGIVLRFEKGRVVEASAEQNEAFLLETLDVDAGARRVGEFAFGLNYGVDKFTSNILFDEKIGGTFHMAIGSAFPETGGKNKSAIHWDMIRDTRGGTTVSVDGKVLLKNGKYTVK